MFLQLIRKQLFTKTIEYLSSNYQPKKNLDTTHESEYNHKMLENRKHLRDLSRDFDSTKDYNTTDGNCYTTVAIHGDAIANTSMHGPRFNVDTRKRNENDSSRNQRDSTKEKKRKNDPIYKQDEKVNTFK